MLTVTAVCAPTGSWADSPDRAAAKFASGAGNILFLAGGIAAPLVEDGSAGRQHALRSLDAVAVTVIVTEGLKSITREQRPDRRGHDSFPSGHTSAAFAVATAESAFHPSQAPLWYLGASLIGASRVRLNAHYWWDVAAGAALGYGITRAELSARHGLLLFPWIGPQRAVGLSAAARF